MRESRPLDSDGHSLGMLCQDSLPSSRIDATMSRMDRATFEELVAEAIDSLPDEVLGWLDNVAIVVGQWPTPGQLAEAGLGSRDLLFGLYVGVPRTHRGFTYGEIIPDKIIIFQGPIERICRTPAQIREQVRRTVLHEIGHHFGMDEGDLRAAGV